MTENENESERGDKLFAEAEKIANKKTFLGKPKDLGKAADKFTQAGNAYNIDRVFKRAGECHMEAARIYLQNKEKPPAANQGIEAAKCYAKVPECIDSAVDAYKFTSELLSENERKAFDAGQCLIDAANLLIEAGRLEDATDLIQRAVEFFNKGTGNDATIARNLDKLADLLAEGQQYEKAVELYDKVVSIKFRNQLTQQSASSVFFKLMLVYLQLGDVIGANKRVQDFLKINPVFKNHQYYQWISKTIAALDKKDIDEFDQVFEDYGKVNTVDPWTRNRFLDMRHLADSEETGDGLL